MLKVAALTAAVFVLQASLPQLPPGLPIPNGSPTPAGAPPAISTTIADAFQQVPQLDDFDPAATRSLSWLPRTSAGAFTLAPGAYAWTVQSYCLNLNAHGPGGDAAYLLAPLRGPQAALVQSAIARAETHPDIAQDTVQMLVWSITSHVNLANPAGAIQQALSTLLTSAEQSAAQASALPTIPSALLDAVAAQLPPELRDAFKSIQGLRGLLGSGTASYDEVARSVSQPAQASNGQIPRSRWTYAPPGYFVRVQSASYSRATVEVYVPEGWTLSRDTSGRLSSLRAANGSAITIDYSGAATALHITERHASPDAAFSLTADATITDTGAEPDDAAALADLAGAIGSSPTTSPSWSMMRDRAADDVARAKAELVCRSLSCAAGPPGAPPATFDMSSLVAAPSDASLQPLAVSARDADTGLAPTVPAAAPAPGPCAHAGTPSDPIPFECLNQVPDLKADCRDVRLEIALEKLIQSLYADPRYVAQANASHLSGGAYAQLVEGHIGAAIASSPLAAQLAAAGVNTGGPGGATSGTGSGTSGSGDTTVGALGHTDVLTCAISIEVSTNEVAAAIWQAAVYHEAVHAQTCRSRPPAERAADDTPASRSADEVKAYNVSIAYMQKWQAAHCH